MFIGLSLESSVKVIVPLAPERCKFKDPGKRDSLYWALSTDITQKSDPVAIFSPFPKMKLASSSSNIKDLYCP